MGIKSLLRSIFFNRKKNFENKIFCISMQRTGTTSVGNFFKHFNYSTAGWRECAENKWIEAWYDGDFESIFNSQKFKETQVFEDTPFWFPEFYKILYHRFPTAKFILFTRNTDDWFRSMLHISKGKVHGEDFKYHAKLYRREQDYYRNIDENPNYDSTIPEQETLLGYEKHYKTYYEVRNREVLDFFSQKSSNRLIQCDLNDTNKWQKIGNFIGFSVPENFEIHSNKSSKEKRVFVEKLLKGK